MARRHGLSVIEDASQAHGACDAHGRDAGSIGDLGCFSFYYAKNLGAYGEAGAVEDVRYHHEMLGFNARPDEIQSAVLRVKLRRLQDWNALRRQHAANYDAHLARAALGRPELILDARHVYHQYVVRCRERDTVLQALRADGIGAAIHYPIPVHLQPACMSLGYREGDLPHTEKAAGEVLSLPMYPELTESQLAYVGKRVVEAVGLESVHA